MLDSKDFFCEIHPDAKAPSASSGIIITATRHTEVVVLLQHQEH